MRRGWSGKAICLDGAVRATEIKDSIHKRVQIMRNQGVVPGLATILVGKDSGSVAYVNGKHQDCAEVGIDSIRVELPDSATTAEVVNAVETLNQDPKCTGYIVQLPLPKQVDTQRVLMAIDPDKDADGLHPTNLGKLTLRVSETLDFPLPCTPRACLDLVQNYGLDWSGKQVCVIGRGTTVGRSLPLLLTRKEVNATVTCCHTGTVNLAVQTKQADILISAAGVAGLVTADMVKLGAVVLDVGVSRGEINPATGKTLLAGDVADGVDEVAGYLSPNPTGIGPLTRANLLLNVVEMAEKTIK